MASAETNETDRRALALFEQVVDLGERNSRERLLAAVPANVRRRLAELEATAAFAHALPTLIPLGNSDGDEPPLPSRLGAFRLVSRIGRGGMGDVWLAHRDDGLYDQQVAIKLIQRHALSRAADAFDAERRFLAKLEHPAVVRLIDGGVSDDGLPWLATEYVDGVTIDAACTDQAPVTHIDWFLAAAAAVQFAHDRLIAHGDIKPSNIMVAYDRQVKLLDFGIARLIGDADGAGIAPFTPAFASPERQAGAPPTTADDIFALGRTLASLTDGFGDAELNAIVAMATADMNRYPTVDSLVADLRRWRAGLPVRAYGSNLTYRLRKFVDRHRAAFLVSGAALFLAGAASLIARDYYEEAAQARLLASSRLSENERVAHFMMFDLIDRLERQSGTLRLRAQVLDTSQRYLEQLARTPDAPAAMKLDAVHGFLRAATIAGIGNTPNLGDVASGKRDLASANTMLVSLARDPAMRQALVAPTVRAAALECQLHIYGEHDASKALASARAGIARVAALDLRSPAQRAAVWPLRICKGDALVWLERPKEAIALLEGELADARRRGSQTDPLMFARNLRFLGEAYFYANDYVSASPKFTQALALLDRERAHRPYQAMVNEYAGIADDLASTYMNQRRYADALRVARKASDMTLAQSSLDPDDLQSVRRALSLSRLVTGALAKLGRVAEANARIDTANARWQSLVYRFPGDASLARHQAMSLAVTGDLRREAKRMGEACAYYRRALSSWEVFSRKWQISPSDVRESVELARHNVDACHGHGTFADS